MCQSVNGPTWGNHPSQREPVGIVGEGYTLLSEGIDDQGIYHVIWTRTRRSPLCIIDRVTEKGGEWYYTREFSCDILECAVSTFLNLFNPNSPYMVQS